MDSTTNFTLTIFLPSVSAKDLDAYSLWNGMNRANHLHCQPWQPQNTVTVNQAKTGQAVNIRKQEAREMKGENRQIPHRLELPQTREHLVQRGKEESVERFAHHYF